MLHHFCSLEVATSMLENAENMPYHKQHAFGKETCQVQQTIKTASSDEELAFKQKERDIAMYTRIWARSLQGESDPPNWISILGWHWIDTNCELYFVSLILDICLRCKDSLQIVTHHLLKSLKLTKDLRCWILKFDWFTRRHSSARAMVPAALPRKGEKFIQHFGYIRWWLHWSRRVRQIGETSHAKILDEPIGIGVPWFAEPLWILGILTWICNFGLLLGMLGMKASGF